MKEWSAAAAEGRRLAEGAAVNATLLLSVPAASEATARQFFTDPVAVESARQMLARDGQPLAALEAMRVERVFAQRADQSDVYSCYDGVLSAEQRDTILRQWRADHTAVSHKVGRNDPCPCGSGKKYKKCRGR